MSVLKIGTRGSDLALYQANLVKNSIEQLGYPCEIVIIKTSGDIDQRDFKAIAGDGFFTKEIERQLLAADIDIAVHSCKDLPSLTHRDLPWVAYSEREEACDILLSKTDAAIKTIGTSSPRRKFQLQSQFPNAEILPLRGNVPTRVKKLIDGNYDAIVLAKAGFKRLQLELPEGYQSKDLDFVTSPCQGILAVQSHQKHFWLLEKIANPELSLLAYGEKEVLRLLGGGCHLAVGIDLKKLKFSFYENGKSYEVSSSTDVYDFYTEILSTLSDNHTSPRVILTHTLSHQLKVAKLFKKNGLGVTPWPLMDVQSVLLPKDLDTSKLKPNLVFTSQHAVKIYFMELLSTYGNLDALQKKSIYTIGKATRKAIESFGLSVTADSKTADSTTLANTLKELQDSITYIGNKDSAFREKLKTDFIEIYQTIPTSPFWRGWQPAAGSSIVFCSPSTVKVAV
ncbi:MAG: hydroxymethylbilane synthase [Bdellovibrionales bacterium]|nr:hydroxymethylbilane synthase [Bdellovibrionales bacterium]